MEKNLPEGYGCTFKSDSGNIADSPGCFCRDPPVDRQCDKKWDLIQMREEFEKRLDEMNQITSSKKKAEVEAELKTFYEQGN